VYGSILDVQEATETVDLNASDVLAMDKDGKDAQGVIIDRSSKALYDDPDGAYTDNMLGVQCLNGDPTKSPFFISFRMETNLGNKYEVDVKMKVKHIPTSPSPITTTTTTT
jgi:hypothetical protein